MTGPTHEQAMLFMEYYKLWDTPADGEAWKLFRTLRDEGVFEDFARFTERVPSGSDEYVLFDRVCCSFEQAGVLMKHGLMHPDLFFDAWASPTSVWMAVEPIIRGLREKHASPQLYANLEWLAKQGEEWYAQHTPDAEDVAARK